MALFLAGVALHLFATTSMGIFMATLARSMPQFGMLLVLVLLPLQMLSGGTTPRESMPDFVQNIMLAAPPPISWNWARRFSFAAPAWASYGNRSWRWR